MHRLIVNGSKRIFTTSINKQLANSYVPLTTSVTPQDNRVEVFVDDKPVLVPPGSTVI